MPSNSLWRACKGYFFLVLASHWSHLRSSMLIICCSHTISWGLSWFWLPTCPKVFNRLWLYRLNHKSIKLPGRHLPLCLILCMAVGQYPVHDSAVHDKQNDEIMYWSPAGTPSPYMVDGYRYEAINMLPHVGSHMIIPIIPRYHGHTCPQQSKWLVQKWCTPKTNGFPINNSYLCMVSGHHHGELVKAIKNQCFQPSQHVDINDKHQGLINVLKHCYWPRFISHPGWGEGPSAAASFAAAVAAAWWRRIQLILLL